MSLLNRPILTNHNRSDKYILERNTSYSGSSFVKVKNNLNEIQDFLHKDVLEIIIRNIKNDPHDIYENPDNLIEALKNTNSAKEVIHVEESS